MTDTTHALSNAQAWFANICEMVATLELDDNQLSDEARETIQESALSIQVRSGWHNPGAHDAAEPAEYEILLTTGGPALRIIGELDRGEPESANLQMQDWGIPWTDVHMSDLCGRETGRGGGTSQDITPSEVDRILLSYANCFYFGGTGTS
jgi:hypothetical protein